MEQTITLRLKLYRPTGAKQAIYRELTRRTTGLANNLVAAGRPRGLTSKTVSPYLPAFVPSAVRNQAIRDVDAAKKVESFQRLWPAFNNQNCRIKRAGDYWTVSFPTHAGRVRVPLVATEKQAAFLERLGSTAKQGAAKLYEKRGRWYLALSITVQVTPCVGTKVAGIDLGLRNLAVVNCEGKTLFFNGDHAAYVRRHYSNLRRRMGKAKALKAIRNMRDKEARWIRNHNHQISREIVNWCLGLGVGLIRMEDLTGIRITCKSRRRDRGRSLHSWAFYQLQQFIEYKARLAGIQVEYVVAKNTSRACPVCGTIDKANRNGIRFHCKACGHQGHADAVAGANISNAISGLAQVA